MKTDDSKPANRAFKFLQSGLIVAVLFVIVWAFGRGIWIESRFGHWRTNA